MLGEWEWGHILEELMEKWVNIFWKVGKPIWKVQTVLQRQ